MSGAKGACIADSHDLAPVHQDGALAQMPRRRFARLERVAGKGQNLSAQKIGHLTLRFDTGRISHGARKGIRPLPLFPRNTFR